MSLVTMLPKNFRPSVVDMEEGNSSSASSDRIHSLSTSKYIKHRHVPPNIVNINSGCIENKTEKWKREVNTVNPQIKSVKTFLSHSTKPVSKVKWEIKAGYAGETELWYKTAEITISPGYKASDVFSAEAAMTLETIVCNVMCPTRGPYGVVHNYTCIYSYTRVLEKPHSVFKLAASPDSCVFGHTGIKTPRLKAKHSQDTLLLLREK